jgi:hypothetical protein
MTKASELENKGEKMLGPNEYPYYYDPKANKFLSHPWHHLMFSQFKWYHRLIGGDWRWVQIDSSFANWQRIKVVK